MRGRLSVIVLTILFVAQAAMAELAPVPPELEALAETVMANRPAAEVERAAEAAESAIRQIADPASRDLHNAQRLFLVGFAALGDGRTDAAVEAIERSMDAARASLLAVESSEGYRILADGYNQLLKVRGRAYQVIHFRDARRSADRAVDLDRRNPLAHVSAASYYLSAPGIAGGDTRRGLEHVEAAARLGGDSGYVRFLVSVWAAQGAAQTGSRASARTSLANAAAIYPDNWWLAEIREELGIGEAPGS
jgi:tetratricopeptide (TPR) repeat protein